MSWATVLLVAQVLSVGPSAEYQTIGAALAHARRGDTIRVAAGLYRERLVVDVPVVLVGDGRPTIDGEGRGTVVTLGARSTLRGFEIRASGRVLDGEDAGILVLADSCVIDDNVLSDVLFGIYTKESDANRITANRITGMDRPLGVRGDGIRLWYSQNNLVERNVVRRTRDVVIYFSHGLQFRDNRVEEGRYGLHYMYSSNNVFERNAFVDNDVAAFIMYSSDIALRDNVFARANGRSGFGIGLKDADRIEITNNLIVQNQVGLYLDNSPHGTGTRNRVQGNILAFNDVAVGVLPSVHSNDFLDNDFIGNVREVAVSGGGSALANRWAGNHWDGAAPWDPDGDGISDLPYRIDRLSDDLFARHPRLRLFELSPAASTLDALARFFPLLEPEPLAVDSTPSVMPRLAFDGSEFGGRAAGAAHSLPTAPGTGNEKSARGGSSLLATLSLGLAALSLWGMWRWRL